jgi:hypothetical protein
MKKALLITTLGISALTVKADDAIFFQASLTPDVAAVSRDMEIDGVSLNIWGENPQTGFALGFVNGSRVNSSGFSLGLVNYSEDYTGVAFGLVNTSSDSFTGWQSGLINVVQGDFSGVQSGLVNTAKSADGLQLGVVNYSEQLHGLQIGVVNIAQNNPWFSEFPSKLAPGFPIVNWSF